MELDNQTNAALLHVKAAFEQRFGKEIDNDSLFTILNFPLSFIGEISKTHESVYIVGLGRFGVKPARENWWKEFYAKPENADKHDPSFDIDKDNEWLKILDPNGILSEKRTTAKNIMKSRIKIKELAEEPGILIDTSVDLDKVLETANINDLVNEIFNESDIDEGTATDVDKQIQEILNPKVANKEATPKEVDFGGIW